jgi:very-short-patch-repair endonuclease
MSLPMFHGAKPSGFEKAKKLRSRETVAEKRLWECLKENKLLGFRFKRQHPIADYIADFYCHRARLVVELDGDYHQNQIEYDNNRTAVMNEFGLKVIRFKNEEVLTNINSVTERILFELKSGLRRI